MSTTMLVIGAIAAIAFAFGYGLLSVTIGLEGRQLVDRCARVTRMTNVGEEDQIYLRRRPRRRWGRARPVAYERPLDVGEVPPTNVPNDKILAPQREVQGRNGEV